MNVFNSFQEMQAAQPGGAQGTMSVFNLGVTYANSNMEAKCTPNHQEQKKLGRDVAREVNTRLMYMEHADTLADLPRIDAPGRYHELTRDLRGHLACDVSEGDRLIFRPTNNPIPTTANGGLDWSKVTTVEITDIGDYH